MKITLRKLETAFPRWSASKFPFSAVNCFLNNLFIKQYLTLHYSKIYNNRPANKKEAKQ